MSDMENVMFGILAALVLALCLPAALAAQEQEKLNFVSSKFEARLYGFIKVDAAYDDSRTYLGNIGFYANSEPGGVNDNGFNFTMNQTRIGLSTKVPNLGSASLDGLVEMDFYGGGGENTPNPRLYKGYVEIRWPTFLILAGQDWDTFSTLYPGTVNFGYLADAGNLQYRRPQLRAVKFFPIAEGTTVSIAAAVARTVAGDLDGGGRADGEDSGFPTAEGRVALDWKILENLPLTLAGSGHFGREEVDWTDGTGKYDSWSLNGEILLPLGDRAFLKGEFFRGANLDAYYGGIGQGINATLRKGIRAVGGWGEITLLPIRPMMIHLGAGVDHPYRQDLNDGDRSQNVAIYGNVSYEVLKSLTVAFEYMRFETNYKNAPHGDDNRYQTAVTYVF